MKSLQRCKWRTRLLVLMVVPCLFQPLHARHHYRSSFTIPISIRGGARGPQTWSASPLGIRKSSNKHSQSQQPIKHPIVEDLTQGEESHNNKQQAKEMMNAFLTRDSRNTFIARVYAILTGQLLVTALSIVVFGTNPGLSSWMHQTGSFIPMLSLLFSTIAWFMVCSSPRARQASPIKWQLLSLFTVGEAISVGFISSFYQFQSVVSSMLATAVATTAVSLYTIFQKNPKYDLSQWGMGLSSIGMIFIVYGLVHVLELVGVLPQGFLPYRESAYCLAGAALFSCYLAYHTKLLVAGKHAKYQMNEKDYVFGAMSLYNDIINMFLYILRMIGEDRER